MSEPKFDKPRDLDIERLHKAASDRTGLADFGPQLYRPALQALTHSMQVEADLNAAGVTAQAERIVNALSNRLRKTDLLNRHPEILDERISVAALIVGLPRTGSTMLHRMLTASPQFTAVRWWESVYPLPQSGGADDRSDRIAKAEALVKQIMASSHGLDAIHPMDAQAFDEELPLVEQSFLSSMAESLMYLPSYGEHLLTSDQTHAYLELIDYLKILQWASPERRGRKWLLKCPHHLSAVRTILDIFPEAKIIMTHRPIEQLMPSWYSMVASLTGAYTDADHSRDQAEHWTRWWKHAIDGLADARPDAEHRFLDVDYKQLLRTPLEQARRLTLAMGLEVTHADDDAWRAWLDSNQRDNRPSHKYSLEQFGIEKSRLEKDFGNYTAEFSSARE